MEAIANTVSGQQRFTYGLLKLGRREWPDQTEIQNDETGDGTVDFRGRTARKSITGGWRASAFVLWYETIERLTLFGILFTLVTYLSTELREGTAESVNNVNIWSGFTMMFPILGAFISDGYLGRYRTIAVMSTLYILGLIFLTLSVTVEPFKPAKCDSGSSTCPEIKQFQVALFFLSLYLIAIGTGGVKPCLQAFGADQFDATDPKEKQKKSSFFNWWGFGLCTGGLLALSVVAYIQQNMGYGITFGTITVAMVISVILFFAGTPFYRQNIPSGSPFNSILQVLVAVIWKWNVKVPDNSDLLYEKYNKESIKGGRRRILHTKDLRFFDKAATKSSGKWSEITRDEERNTFLIDGEDTDNLDLSLIISPCRLCTVTQVEEVKQLLRIIPIWITSFIFGTVSAQMVTFFTKQGNTMDRQISSNFNIPAASLATFGSILFLILLPIYDRLFVPIARQITGIERGITMLQRIGIGLYLCIITMIAAAWTESMRLKTAEKYGLIDNPNATIPMSIFWLLPQYLLFSFADVTTMVGQQEFFYDQVPDSMRSIGMALYLSIYGLGSFISSFLISLIDSITTKYEGKSWFSNNLNRSHLDRFYLLLALLCAFNFCTYLFVARSYTYKRIG